MRHVPKTISDPPRGESCAEYLKALADEDRLQLIRALGEREQCVSDLSALLDLAIGNVSHHLKVLRHQGLVVVRREGRQMIYSLAPKFRGVARGRDTCLDLGCCRFQWPRQRAAESTRE